MASKLSKNKVDFFFKPYENAESEENKEIEEEVEDDQENKEERFSPLSISANANWRKIAYFVLNKENTAKTKQYLVPYNVRKYKNQRRCGISANLILSLPLSKTRSRGYKEPAKPLNPRKKKTTLSEISDVEEITIHPISEADKTPISKTFTKKFEGKNSFLRKKESFNQLLTSLKGTNVVRMGKRKTRYGKLMTQMNLEKVVGTKKSFSKEANLMMKTRRHSIDKGDKKEIDRKLEMNQKAKSKFYKENKLISDDNSLSDDSISEAFDESCSTSKVSIPEFSSKPSEVPLNSSRTQYNSLNHRRRTTKPSSRIASLYSNLQPRLASKILKQRKPSNPQKKKIRPKTCRRRSKKSKQHLTLDNRTLKKSYKLEYFPWDLFIKK